MNFLRKKEKPTIPARRRPTDNKPAVFSYYARGASPSSQNIGRNDKPKAAVIGRYRLRLGHVPSYIALTAIVIALGYSCTLQPNPKIVLLQTTGTVHRDPKAYQDGVQAIWKQSLLNRTKLTVSTSAIRQDILSQFGELSAVHIEFPLLGRRPTVLLTPTQPALQFITSNGSFYVDANGKTLARTTDLLQNELKDVPTVQDETGVIAEPGKGIIPASQALFLGQLYAQLRAGDVAIASITLPARVANEADVRIDGLPYLVKFSLDSDPRQAVGSYLAAKTKLAADGIKPAEYIDVRVGEKVFYK